MAFLRTMEGPASGQVFVLEAINNLGRNPDNTVYISDGRLSRHHARIICEGDGSAYIVDLGSANGTWINGKAIERGETYELEKGDTLAVGSSVLVYGPGSPEDDEGSSVSGRGDGSSNGFSIVFLDEDLPQRSCVSASIDASLSIAQLAADIEPSDKDLSDAVTRLQAMVQISSDLGGITAIKAVVEKIMENIFAIFPQADRAFIMLTDPATGEMRPTMGRDRKGKTKPNEELAISRTIIEAVINNKQSVLLSDALEDDRFKTQRSVVRHSIRSMACAPFIWHDEILGLISVDTTSLADSFDSDDLKMLTGIAGPAAIAIKNAELYDAVEEETKRRTMLSRYISPDVVDGVLDGTIALDLSGEKKHGTVFFCDIVGFTALAEQLPAVEVIDLLNDYFKITTGVVTKHRGTLHKFAGDMIMAFWNVLLPDDEAERNAATTGLALQAAVWAFNLDLAQSGQPPIHVGVGINTGEFAGGNVGGEMIEYTIIGDSVNLAQRIETLSGRWQVFVSESTYATIADDCAAVALPPASVKGKSELVSLYSIRGVKTETYSMRLLVPVEFSNSEGEALGEAMLTGSRETPSGQQFVLLTQDNVPEGADVTLKLLIPELAEVLEFSATVKSTDAETTPGGVAYTKVVLAEPRGAKALMFLTPGSPADSGRTWPELERG